MSVRLPCCEAFGTLYNRHPAANRKGVSMIQAKICKAGAHRSAAAAAEVMMENDGGLDDNGRYYFFNVNAVPLILFR
eukprot:scaffold28569_cov343-Skeletonema_menzelii.AAC.1